jgi:hypothetical protein
MVWPSALVVVTLYNTLHAVGDDTQESRDFMKARMRFFSTVFMLIFVYQVQYSLPPISFFALFTPYTACGMRTRGKIVHFFFLLRL